MSNPFRYVNACDPELAIPRPQALGQVLCHIQRGEYVCVLAPRQSGKTTFFKRDLLPQLRGHYRVRRLDLEHVPRRDVLRTFQRACELGEASSEGRDPGQPVRYFGLKDWLNRGAGDRQIVFLIDELPKDNAVAIDVLTNVRAYVNEASSEPKAQRHLFVFAGSDELARLTNRDSPVSVFNIAHEVHLEDFTLAESSTLIRRLARPTERARIFNGRTIDRVFALTQGHPYLVQLLCSWIYDHPKQRDAVLASAEDAVRFCHIDDSTNAQAMMGRFNQDDVIVKEGAILEAVLTGRPVLFAATVMAHKTLHLQGCIRDSDGLCAVRNPIYAEIFRRFFQVVGPPGHGPTEADLLADVRVLLAKILTGNAGQNESLLIRVFDGFDPDPTEVLQTNGTPEDLAANWAKVLRQHKCLDGRSALGRLLEEGYRRRQVPKPNHFESFDDLLKALDAPCAELVHPAPPAAPAPRRTQGRAAKAPKPTAHTPQPAAVATPPGAVSVTPEQHDRLKALLEAVFKGMNAAARKAFLRDAIGRGHVALNDIQDAVWGEAPSVAADTVADALYRHRHLPASGGYDLVAAINRQVRAQELDGNPDIQPHLE